MNFDWSQQELELICRIREFAQSELVQPVAQRDHDMVFGRHEWHACGAQGLLGLPIPQRYGGGGHSCLMTARIMQTLGEIASDRGLLFSAAAHTFACAVPIWKHASECLKREWLPRLCSGECIGANAATEREAGSDIFALRTVARREGGEYVLDGAKSFVSNAPVANVFVVYAATDKSLGPLGTSAFLVPRETPGLKIGEPFHTLGLRTAPMSTISLEACRIPMEFLLQSEGAGKAVFEASMTWERLCLFGIWLGLMEAQIAAALAYSKMRWQFGKPIGKNQAVSHRIADMKLRLESARCMLYRACWLFDQQRCTAVDCSMAKLAVSEAAVLSSLDVVQIHGASGILSGTGLEQGLRDAIPGTIYSGTSEMHREIIARSLGL